MNETLCTRAQLEALDALGACFGRVRRMAAGQKFLIDLNRNPARQLVDCGIPRDSRTGWWRLSHASDAQVGPHRARIGPIAEQGRQRSVVGRQIDHQTDELVAAVASLLAETLAFQPHDLA